MALPVPPFVYPGQGGVGPEINMDYVVGFGPAALSADVRGNTTPATTYAIVFTMASGAAPAIWTYVDDEDRDAALATLQTQTALVIS